MYFSDVKEVNTPSFYIEMFETSTTIDDVYFDRVVQVDITYIPLRDTRGRVNKADLYNTADALDVLIRPIFYVQNRAITILSAEKTVVDDVAHYIFTLPFTDAWTDEEKGRPQYDAMQTLELEVK